MPHEVDIPFKDETSIVFQKQRKFGFRNVGVLQALVRPEISEMEPDISGKKK